MSSFASILRQFNDEEKESQLKIKNTQTFKPDWETPDMRVMFGNGIIPKYLNCIQTHDVIIIPNLFVGMKINYEILRNEVNNSNLKLWHGNSHYIADDATGWKNNAPFFKQVLNKITKYFNMRIEATRFNVYQNGNEHKPYHFDAAAVKQDKAVTQNITVGITFGATRSITFQHSQSKNKIEFPLSNGFVYAFAKDVNVLWRHGIPPSREADDGRISIIAWGFTSQTEKKIYAPPPLPPSINTSRDFPSLK